MVTERRATAPDGTDGPRSSASCGTHVLDAAQGARTERCSWWRMLRHVTPLYRWQRALPDLHLEVSAHPAGTNIKRAFSGRRRGIPRAWAVSVLELPADPARYLVGRHRQAVRTNRRRALRSGLTVVEETDRARVGRRIEDLSRSGLTDDYRSWLDTRDSEGESRLWFALDPDGQCVGVAVVVVDSTVARLGMMKALEVDDKSAVRFLLSAQIFMQLAREGVRHVVVGSAIFVSPGLRYFQDRLGFTLANVRVREVDDLDGPRDQDGSDEHSSHPALVAVAR